VLRHLRSSHRASEIKIIQLFGGVRKVYTYIYINVVGELGRTECSKQEANTKTQVCKSSDTGRKAVGCVEEFCNGGIRNVRNETRKPYLPANVVNMR